MREGEHDLITAFAALHHAAAMLDSLLFGDLANLVQWRQLDSAHNKRNLAEYEGYLEVEASYLQGLIALVENLLNDAENLVKPG